MSAYDLVVIGSGPAGQRAAIAAAKLGRKVAVGERHPDVGGGCIHRGTIPSKTLREVVAYLSGIRQRHIYGVAHRVKERITIADLTFRTQRVIENKVNVVRDQLLRNYVEIVPGTGRFGSDPRHVVVTGEDVTRTLTADRVLIATGTRPGRPPGIEFDDRLTGASGQPRAARAAPPWRATRRLYSTLPVRRASCVPASTRRPSSKTRI